MPSIRFWLFSAVLAAAAQSGAADEGGIFVRYSCDNGTSLAVTFKQDPDEAIVDLADGTTLTLPIAPSGSGFYYSNGRYGLRGKADEAMWEIGRMAPIDCRADEESSG